jgi:hypothetical protein
MVFLQQCRRSVLEAQIQRIQNQTVRDSQGECCVVVLGLSADLKHLARALGQVPNEKHSARVYESRRVVKRPGMELIRNPSLVGHLQRALVAPVQVHMLPCGVCWNSCRDNVVDLGHCC